MIDPKVLREDPDRVRAAQAKRGLSDDVVDRALAADSARRAAIVAFEAKRAEQKQLGKQIPQAQGDQKAALLERTKALSAEVKAAEAAQATNGGGNPRLRGAFEAAAPAEDRAPAAVSRCLIVSDVPTVRDAVVAALAARGIEHVDAGTPGDGFEVVAGRLEGILQESGPIDAVVIAFAGTGTPGASREWQQILDEHEGITDDILRDSTWIRVLADHAKRPR